MNRLQWLKYKLVEHFWDNFMVTRVIIHQTILQPFKSSTPLKRAKLQAAVF